MEVAEAVLVGQFGGEKGSQFPSLPTHIPALNFASQAQEGNSGRVSSVGGGMLI